VGEEVVGLRYNVSRAVGYTLSVAEEHTEWGESYGS
jgi:hypothetical protein